MNLWLEVENVYGLNVNSQCQGGYRHRTIYHVRVWTRFFFYYKKISIAIDKTLTQSEDWIAIIYLCWFSFFLKIFYLFLERGEGRQKERERHINVWLLLVWSPLGTLPATQACTLSGNRNGDPLVCSPCSIHWAIPVRANWHYFS